MNRGYYHAPYSRHTEWGGVKRGRGAGALRLPSRSHLPPCRATLACHAMKPDRLAAAR